MLTPALTVLGSEQLILEYLAELLAQYPRHTGELHELRRRKRRSEFVQVTLEIGGPTIKGEHGA